MREITSLSENSVEAAYSWHGVLRTAGESDIHNISSYGNLREVIRKRSLY